MVIFVAVAGVSCCGLGGGVAAAVGIAGRGEGALWAVVLVYVIVLPLMIALYAIQQAVTMELVRARARGSTPTIDGAIRRGLARTPALVAHTLLRGIVEVSAGALVFAIVGTAAISLRLALHHDGSDDPFERSLYVAAALVGYLGMIVVAIALRARYGLGYPAIIDGTGPYDAFRRSIDLLAGRRWQFIRFRLAMLATWVGAYVVCMTPTIVSSLLPDGGTARIATTLVGAVLVFGFYALAYALAVFDAAAEMGFYLRVTRGFDGAELARTFE
jgi:hypothetical protein